MTYDAGTSKGVYLLDATQALAQQAALVKGYQALGKAAAIKPPPVQAGGANVTAEQVKIAQAIARTAEAEARLAVATNKRIESDARAARTISQTALVDQKRATEAAKTAAADDRAAVAALRRSQAEAKAARPPSGGGGPALPRTFAGFTQAGAGQLAGLAGGALSIQALVGAGQESLALRETQNGLRAVSGSVDNYQKTLRSAREQQELFGGTLRENIEGLTGLTITSRQSGASLDSLIDLSQRLAVLDPAQGAAGARIALSEALSGDPTSLAKRYEIPRAALAKLRDESTTAGEKLLIIDQYLNKVGISSEAVAGRIDQDALAFRKAKAEIEEATLKLGDYLTKIAAVPARGITDLLNTGGVAPGAVAAGNQVSATLLSQGQDFQTYADGVQRANQQLQDSFKGDPLLGFYARSRLGLQALTPAQFAYAQSLIATGTASAVALQQAQALGTVDAGLAPIQTQVARAGGEIATTYERLTPLMFQVSAQSQANAADVRAAADAFSTGDITGKQFEGILQALVGAHAAATAAALDEARETRRLAGIFGDATPAAGALKDALAAQAIEAEKARQKSQELSDVQSSLASIGGAVRDGLITSGEGASILAGALQLPIDKARELLDLQAQIAGRAADVQATIDRSIARAGASDLGKKDIDIFGLPTEKDVKQSQQIIADAKTAGQAQQQAAAASFQKGRDLADSEFQLRLALAKTNADKIALYQGQLNKTTDQAERNRIQATIASLRNSGGGGASKGISIIDQDAIQKGEDAKAQLAEVNKLLERTNLTEHQRNDLLEKRHKLEAQISDEVDKQARASVDAQLGSVRDAQDRLKEARETAGLQRQLQSGRFSGAQQETARLRLAEIGLEQQKRALDIQKDAKTAGLAVADTTQQQAAAATQQAQAAQAITQPLPIPNLATLPPAQPTALNLSLTIQLDPVTGAATVTNAPAGSVIDVIVKAGVKG